MVDENIQFAQLPGPYQLLRERTRPGTNFHRLGVPHKLIGIGLRHSNVNFTPGHYVKPQTLEVVAAMGKLEAEITAHDLGGHQSDTEPDIGGNTRIREPTGN